jgi:CelD/BcsL family acetyltransferase involved in cellulose biosynthesis
MEVLVTRSVKELDLLREEWADLLSRCPQATIFQTWEWNRTWWDMFGTTEQLFLLQIREKDQLVGIAPLYITRSPRAPVRKLVFVGNVITDYTDILAPVESAREVWDSVLRYSISERLADFVELQNLCSPAALWDSIATLCKTGFSLCWKEFEGEGSCCVALPATWNEYLKRLSNIVRSNLMRRRRNLVKAVTRVEARLADDTEVPRVMTALFDLHQKRWNSRQMPGNLKLDRVRQFHRKVAEQFQRRGWLRLHYLRVEEQIVAVQYAFRFRDRYYGYLNGFDPAFRRFSPGSSLIAAAIQQAISEGCSEFDLLRGEEHYKSQWLTQSRRNRGVALMRNNLRPRFVFWLDRAEQESRLAIGRIRSAVKGFAKPKSEAE